MLWSSRLDDLERHLDEMPDEEAPDEEEENES
jgi:hypothetical protein